MINWNRERQDIIYNKKLQNVKSTLSKAQLSQGHTIQKKKQSLPQQTSHKKQDNLKYLLREFGLIQYLRKMYELGYDDNSIMKLGMLSLKEFEELQVNLKLFPGHQIKMENLQQYIKQTIMQNSIPIRKPGTSNAMRRPHTTNQRKNKSYSSKPKYLYQYNQNVKRDANNPMLDSFMRGEFGYDYYCSNNKNIYNYNGQANQIDIQNINEREGNCDLMKNANENKINEKKDNGQMEEINNNIDDLLDYYMAQLNVKLDNSLDSIEDSSLSNHYINEIVKKEEESNKERKKNANAKRIKVDKDNIDIGIENISEIEYHNHTDNSMSHIKEIKEQTIKENMKRNNVDKIDQQQPIEIKEKEDEIIEEFFDKKDREEEEIEEQLQQLQQPKANESKYDNNNKQNLYYSQLSKTEGNEKPNDGQYNYTTSNNQSESNEQTEEKDEEYRKYSKEQTIYENLRLTKSYEGNSTRQHPEQFDIEYMCRCLALSIMKHLESSKDKTHITDLLTQNETFTFFNSLYNSNVSFLHNFFNKDNPSSEQISNLDRLDLIDKANESTQPQISFLKHISKEGKLKQDENKKYQNLKDIDNNIKFIDEFFSVSKKIRYKNLSERAMTVLNKELSYINEVDSNMDSRLDNSNLTNKKETTDNILRQSLQHIIMKTNANEDNDNDNDKEDKIKSNQTEPNKSGNIKLASYYNKDSEDYTQTPINSNIIPEEIIEDNQANEVFESGDMESNYAIDATTVDKLKSYLLKQAEVYDDDYLYSGQRIPTRKYIVPPDPQVIFEFCANIMILTKMEKEVIIVALIYLERLIFNTGLLITSRNWRRISFTVLIIASKIWDDDSFENNHFAQVFTHLKIGEINLLERVFLELINYKVYVKCSEYFKYFFIIKSIALKYNYNGNNLIPISVEHMMKIQEYAFQMQKKMKKKYSLINSAQF